MSNNIDERIVEMYFDNSQFNDGIQESISSLDALRKSLDTNTKATKLNNFINIFKGVASVGSMAVNAFTGISRSIKGFVGNITGLNSLISQQVSKMRETFSALTGGALASGFEEYELKINSVRTILSNVQKSGKTIDDVSDALERLNKYADQTIYNFGEMTRNIGYFTVAGVGLDESVAAIKGFSNLAALSGVNSQAAARATYQLSQAMSTGSMRLVDWRSMENAGMGGMQFQEMLIDVAKKSGVQYDKLLKKHKSFRETLSEGWLTSDIMLKTLQLYSGDFGDDFVESLALASKSMEDQSFVSKAYQKILAGDEEAVKKYGISLEELNAIENEDDKKRRIAQAIASLDVEEREAETIEYIAKAYKLTQKEAADYYKVAVRANQAAKEVTTFTKLIDALKEAAQSGWSASWELIFGNAEQAKYIWTAVSDEIGGVLGRSADARNQILKEWREGTATRRDEKGQIIGTKLFDAIANFYLGIKGIAGEFSKVLSTMFKPIDSSQLIAWTDRLYDISVKFRAFVEGTGDVPSGLSKLTPLFTAVGNAIMFVRRSISSLVKGGIKLIYNLLTSKEMSAGLSAIGSAIGTLFTKLSESQLLQKFISLVGRVLTPVIRVLGTALSWVVDGISKLFDYLKDIGVLDSIASVFSNIGKYVNIGIETLNKWANSIINWLKGQTSLKDAGTWIKNTYKTISNSLKGFAKDALKWIQDNKIFSKIGNFFLNAFGKIKDLFTGKISFSDLFGDFLSSLGKLPGFFSKLLNKFAPILDKIKNFFVSIWDAITGLFTGKKSKASGGGGGGGGKPGSAARKSLMKIKGMEIVNELKGEANGMWNNLKQIPAVFAKVWDWFATSVIPSIKSGFSTAWNWISSKLSPFFNNGLEGFFTSIWNVIKTVGSTVWNSIITAGGWVANAIKTVADTIKKIADYIMENAAAITALTTSIGILLNSLGKISIGRGIRKVGKGIEEFGEGIKSFSRTIRRVSGARAFKKKMKSLALLIASIALLIAVIAGSIALFAVIDEDGYKNVAKGMKFFAGMVAGILAMMAILFVLDKVGGKGSIKGIGIGVLGMALSIVTIIYALKMMTDLLGDENFVAKLWPAIGLITLLLAIVAAAGRLSGGKANVGKRGLLNFLGMGLSLILVIYAVKKMTKLIDDYNVLDVFHASLFLGGLLVLVGVAGRLLNNSSVGKGRKVTGLIKMALSLILVTYAVGKLTKLINTYSVGEVILASGIIVAMMAMLVGVAYLSKKVVNVKWSKILKGILLLSVVVAAIILVTNSLQKLSSLEPGKLWSSLGAFAVIFGGVSVAFALFGRKSKSWGSIVKGFGSLAIVVAAIYGVTLSLQKLAGINSASLMQNTQQFLMAFGIMAAAFAVFGVLPITAIGKGALAILVIVAALVGTAWIFEKLLEWLADLPEIESKLKKGSERLDMIGQAIGSFVGSIFGGFIGGTMASASSYLEEIGTNLSKFSDAVAPFMDGFMAKISGFNMEDFQKLTEFATAIAKFNPTPEVFAGGGLFVKTAQSWVALGYMYQKSTEYSSYAEAVRTILASMQEFIGAMEGYDTETQTNVDNAIASLTTLFEALNKINGPIEDFVGGGVFVKTSEITKAADGSEYKSSSMALLGVIDQHKASISDIVSGLAQLLPAYATFALTAAAIPSNAEEKIGTYTEKVAGFIKGISGIQTSVASSGAGGVLAWSGSAESFALLGYAYTERIGMDVMATAVAKLIEAYTVFIEVVAKDIPDDAQTKIEEVTTTLTDFVTAVSAIKTPVVGSTAAGGLAWSDSADTFAFLGYAATKRVSMDAFVLAIGTLLGAYANFLTAVTAEGFPTKAEIDGYMQTVVDFVAGIAGIKMPTEEEVASGVGATTGGVFATMGYAYKKYTTINELSNAISVILKAVGPFLEKVTSLDATNSEITTALENVKNFVLGIAQVQLPTEATETISKGFLYSDSITEHATKFTDLAGGIETILGAYGEFSGKITSLTELNDEGTKNKIVWSLEQVRDFLNDLAQIKLPTAKKVTRSSNVFTSDYSEAVRTSFSDLTANLDTLIPSFADFIAKVGELTYTEEGQQNVSTALDQLRLFLESLSEIDLPVVSTEKLTEYGDIVEKTVYTDFNSFTGSLAPLLEAFSKFVKDITSLTTLNSGGQNKVEWALGELTTFLNNLATIELPLESGVGVATKGIIALKVAKTSWKNFAEGTGELLGYFTTFIENVTSLIYGEEGQAQVEVALGQLKGLLTDLEGYELPKKWAASFSKGIEVSVDWNDFVDSIGGMGEGLAAFYKALSDTDVKQTIIDLNSEYGDTGYFGSLNVANFVTSFLRLFTDFWTIANTLGNAYVGNIYDDFNVVKTIFNNMGNLIDNIVKVFNDGSEETEHYLESFTSLGSQVLTKLVNGMLTSDEGSDALYSTWDAIMTPALKALENYTSQFNSIGANFAAGLAKGITGGASLVSAAANLVASAATVSVAGAWDEASPSKVAARMGAFFDLGLAKGIDDGTGVVETAATDMATSTYDSLASTFARLGFMIDHAASTSPAIRPVMDLSNVSAGFRSIDAMAMANRSIDLATTQKAAQAAAEMNITAGRQNGAVVDAIHSMSGRIDALSETMSHMQLVMDSGIVAGELTPAISKRMMGMVNTARRRTAT